MARRLLAAVGCVLATARGIKVGDTLPDLSLDEGFPPEKVSLKGVCSGKTIVLVGLPGAFTPTCSTKQIPGYLAKQAELKAAGVSDVIIYSVNDGAVIDAWKKDQGTGGSIIRLLGDPRSEVTTALGVTLSHPGPMSVLGNARCQRFSMLVKDCVVKTFNLAASESDPAGDDAPEVSMVDKMLKDLSSLKDEL